MVENMDQNGYRSRSATRSPSSRLFSSTVASRAKQINHSLVESNNSNSRKYANSTRSGGARGGSPSRGHGGRKSQDREASLQSYTDFRQVSEDGGSRSSSSRSKTYSTIHRSGSSATTSSRTMTSSSSSKSSSDVSRRKSSGSGSVKIALSSLKKASIDSWDNADRGNSGNQNGKRKSVSSVYIG